MKEEIQVKAAISNIFMFFITVVGLYLHKANCSMILAISHVNASIILDNWYFLGSRDFNFYTLVFGNSVLACCNWGFDSQTNLLQRMLHISLRMLHLNTHILSAIAPNAWLCEHARHRISVLKVLKVGSSSETPSSYEEN